MSWIRDEVPEYACTRLSTVDDRNTKRLIDRLGKVDSVVLPTSEKETLVLLDRPSDFKSVLAHPDHRLRCLLGIGKPLVSVQCVISKETECRSVVFAGSAACGDRN